MQYDDGFPDDFDRYYEGMVDARELEDIMGDIYEVVNVSLLSGKVARAEKAKAEWETMKNEVKELHTLLSGYVEQLDELLED
jgi:hypothetical protein